MCESSRILTFGIRATTLGVVMRLIAQQQIEERVDGTENEIMGLKEMMLEMKKLMDRMADELRENHRYKRREEARTAEGPMLKLKEKLEDTETTAENSGGNVDRSKYKKL